MTTPDPRDAVVEAAKAWRNSNPFDADGLTASENVLAQAVDAYLDSADPVRQVRKAWAEYRKKWTSFGGDIGTLAAALDRLAQEPSK